MRQKEKDVMVAKLRRTPIAPRLAPQRPAQAPVERPMESTDQLATETDRLPRHMATDEAAPRRKSPRSGPPALRVIEKGKAPGARSPSCKNCGGRKTAAKDVPGAGTGIRPQAMKMAGEDKCPPRAHPRKRHHGDVSAPTSNTTLIGGQITVAPMQGGLRWQETSRSRLEAPDRQVHQTATSAIGPFRRPAA